MEIKKIIESLKKDPEFLDLIQSESFDFGDSTAEEVASLLLSNPEFINKVTQEPAELPTAAQIASEITSDPAFVQNLKSELDIPEVIEAEPPKIHVPDAEDVANELKKDQRFIDALKGKNIDPQDVATILMTNEYFIEMVKGEPGKPGSNITITAREIRDKLRSLPKGEKLKISDIDDLEDALAKKVAGATQNIVMGGGDKHFTLSFTSLNEVQVYHNLNKFPSPVIVDSAGDEVEGTVTHVDKDHLVIQFSAPFTGVVHCN